MKKEKMKIIGRTAASKRLGMSAQALSCHVSRRSWETGAIPKPIKIGGRWKWIEEKIDEFILDLYDESKEPSSSKKQRGPGRPRKTRSTSCP
ncbi:MAG: hypothetical protein OCC46_02765 [Pseudodesulfovibrio sp.]